MKAWPLWWLLVVLLVAGLPLLAQESASPWSIEILDVRAETELSMRVGLSTTTYTAVNDFVFYVVEVALTYTNVSSAPISIDLSTDSFWMANMSDQRVSASGTAGPVGGCVDCVSTFPLTIAAGDSVSLEIPLVFVVAGDDVLQRFMLEFEELEPIPVLLGDGSTASRATATPRPAPPTATPQFAPTPEGTLTPTVIDVPYCTDMIEQGNLEDDAIYLCIEGDQDDWPSKGQSILLQPPQDTLSLGCTFNDGGVCFTSGDWLASFAPPAGEPLTLGLYEDAQRIPFQESGHPGLDVAQYGGCNTLDGCFDVRELEVDPDTGEVTLFSAVFEQYCDGGSVGLRGIVRWSAEGTK